MDMLEIPVTLIVKAPNQQVEDQTIHCSLSWTIKRLKGYLSEVYPNKPNTEDQRLIYYGQLLNDSVTLKDVFTRYEAGEETHTVHLVCMPSKDTFKKRGRQEGAREVPQSPAASAESGRLSAEGSSQPGPLPQTRIAYPPNMDVNMFMQQLAYMQQSYANYYNYMWAQQQGHLGLQEGYMDPRQRLRQDGQVQEQQQPLQQPAAQQVDGPLDEEDNRVNRDWLDYFYIMSRVLVLLSIVCFYSSPARFTIVSILGITMYLYQIGFFRLNQMQAFENNNENLNNNVPAENNNVGEPPAAGAEPQAEVVEPVQERPSFIAVTWTFFTSFFASLIPDTQNAI